MPGAYDDIALDRHFQALGRRLDHIEEQLKRIANAGGVDYATFAEVSLVPKMAERPQQVLDFLADLAARARPYGERDWAELGAFAAAELGLARVEAWDIAFASERLRQARYAFSDQEVKQYFPEPKVLAGMFRLGGDVDAAYDDGIEAILAGISERATRRAG